MSKRKIASLASFLLALAIWCHANSFPSNADDETVLNHRRTSLRSLISAENLMVESEKMAKQEERDEYISLHLSGMKPTSTNQSKLSHVEVNLYDRSECGASEHLEYVDCGFDGHIYATELYCHGQKTRRVIIKVKTILVNGTSHFSGARMYTSYDHTDQPIKRALHHLLLSKNTRRELDDQFVVPIGIAHVPHGLLHEGIKKANDDCVVGRYEGLIHSTNHASTMLEAYVLPFVRGKLLCNVLRENPAIATRQQIVRGLVSIYRHMYERQIFHCDISCYHFLIDGNQTALIDFQRHVIAPNELAHRQQTQLWQLLFLIGDTCTDTTGDESTMKFGVPMNSCNLRKKGEFDTVSMMNGLNPAMNECSFPQNFPWNNQTLESIEQTYKDLALWSNSGHKIDLRQP
jgi:hypothetical protein